MIPSPASRAAFFLAATVMVSGCASYRLGPVNPAIPAGQAIEVGLFQNATPQPGLTESVNASIRRELQRDGTFELATGGDGDVLLTGNITAYRRSAVSFQPRDILSVRDFEVELVTRILAAEKATGKVLIDQRVDRPHYRPPGWRPCQRRAPGAPAACQRSGQENCCASRRG